jgi:branched-chain amino acid transport system ATP-binding protein
MTGDAPLLSLHSLVKNFGGIAATNDVSLEVATGSITAVIGPNGAGKTTLFNLIAGFYQTDKGHIELCGNDITNRTPDQIAKLGLIRTFQLCRPFSQMTAFENVLVGFHLQTRGNVLSAIIRPRWFKDQEREIRERASELLDLVGLGAEKDTPALNLTYGQQRLLEIARGLAAKPLLLMLDEPAAGLTAPETVHLAHLIKTIRDQGLSVLLIEHDIELVMGIADRICVLDFGRRIACGTAAQVQRDPAVIDAYLGSSTSSQGPITTSAASA